MRRVHSTSTASERRMACSPKELGAQNQHRGRGADRADGDAARNTPRDCGCDRSESKHGLRLPQANGLGPTEPLRRNDRADAPFVLVWAGRRATGEVVLELRELSPGGCVPQEQALAARHCPVVSALPKRCIEGRAVTSMRPQETTGERLTALIPPRGPSPHGGPHLSPPFRHLSPPFATLSPPTMTEPLQSPRRRCCKGCQLRREASKFDRLPNGVRNGFCRRCVNAARAELLAKQAKREQEQERRRIRASWAVTR